MDGLSQETSEGKGFVGLKLEIRLFEKVVFSVTFRPLFTHLFTLFCSFLRKVRETSSASSLFGSFLLFSAVFCSFSALFWTVLGGTGLEARSWTGTLSRGRARKEAPRANGVSRRLSSRSQDRTMEEREVPRTCHPYTSRVHPCPASPPYRPAPLLYTGQAGNPNSRANRRSNISVR